MPRSIARCKGSIPPRFADRSKQWTIDNGQLTIGWVVWGCLFFLAMAYFGKGFVTFGEIEGAMDAVAWKTAWIQKLENHGDGELLASALKLFESSSWDEANAPLTSSLESLIEIGLAEERAGLAIDNEVLNAEVEAWLASESGQ